MVVEAAVKLVAWVVEIAVLLGVWPVAAVALLVALLVEELTVGTCSAAESAVKPEISLAVALLAGAWFVEAVFAGILFVVAVAWTVGGAFLAVVALPVLAA